MVVKMVYENKKYWDIVLSVCVSMFALLYNSFWWSWPPWKKLNDLWQRAFWLLVCYHNTYMMMSQVPAYSPPPQTFQSCVSLIFERPVIDFLMYGCVWTLSICWVKLTNCLGCGSEGHMWILISSCLVESLVLGYRTQFQMSVRLICFGDNQSYSASVYERYS